MGFIGGDLQERFVERVRGVDPGRLLAVPIGVGKASAAALVCDFWGEVVVPPFTFPLTAPGVDTLRLALARAEAARDAAWVRAGLEQAGHYHRTLLARLVEAGVEVALLNPSQVKENRTQSLLRSLKSDATDLGAMAELLVRGKGRPAGPGDDQMAAQVVEAARDALGLPSQVRAVHASVLAADVALLGALDAAIARAEDELAEVLPRTPGGDPHYDAPGGGGPGLLLRCRAGGPLQVPHGRPGLPDGGACPSPVRVRRADAGPHLHLPGGQG